jgi:hypothetical protein
VRVESGLKRGHPVTSSAGSGVLPSASARSVVHP